MQELRTFSKVMAANRGEIAIRIFRACYDLDLRTVAIYSKEDMMNLFRTKADEAYLIGEHLSPLGAYLAIDEIIALAKKRGVSMTEISLAWLLTKVTAPIVGATKLSHVEGMTKAADLCLTKEEINYLEEPYVPHALVGVMAQNTAEQAKEKHVWSTGNQKL